jgi:uncharacterized protein YaaW (UPF0174 family)
MPAGLIKQPSEIAPASNDLTLRSAREEIELSGVPFLPLIADDELVAVLRQASNEMLEPLVEYICKKGRPTSRLEQTLKYRKYTPNHRMYADEIAAEIQRYGANDIASFIRGGKGVRYSEIVKDVAKRCGVKSWPRKTEKLEKEIVQKILCDAYEKMPPEQQVDILRSLRIRNATGASGPLSLVAFHAAVNAAGFSAYQFTVIVANGMAQAILGHGLGFATNWILVKSVFLLSGPPGLALAGVLTANMVAGPAYRVTIPCVVQVTLIREQLRIRRRRRLAQLFAGFLVCAALALLAYYLSPKR